MTALSAKKCMPCEGGTPPLDIGEINIYFKELHGRWEKVMIPPDGHIKKIRSQFMFSDFKTAMGFVDQVAKIAESEGHHPDIHIFYNKVIIELWTHAVGGLSENDFIMASKIEELNQRSNAVLSKNNI